MAALNGREGSDVEKELAAWINQSVELFGLKGAAELNGRVGRVQRIAEGSSERVEVVLAASGDAPERTLSVRPANLKALVGDPAEAAAPAAVAIEGGAGSSSSDADADAASSASAPPKRRPRPTAFMTARPGDYKAGYDWRAVYPGQQLPRGLEIFASLSGKEDEPTLARIPPKWKLTVAVRGAADDSAAVAHVRLDVERLMTVAALKAAIAEAEPTLFAGGQPANVEVDGVPWSGADSDTAEKARLFGRAVSCVALRPAR